MNKLELKKLIIDEGRKRGIIVTNCSIVKYSDNVIRITPTIVNEYKDNWILKYQVEDLVADVIPLELVFKVGDVYIDCHRTFKIDDIVQLDNVWIRLDVGEEEQKDLIDVSAYCGLYRKGWVKGTIFETPEQNDRALGVKFSRDVYIQKDTKIYINSVSDIENEITKGNIYKVEKGQPVYCGTGIWGIRKIRSTIMLDKTICPICGSKELVKKTINEEFEYKGEKLNIGEYVIYKCHNCKEAIIDEETIKSTERILIDFKRRIDEKA